MRQQTLNNKMQHCSLLPRSTSRKAASIKSTLLSLVFACVMASSFIWTPVASASTKVRFKQIIAPLNCLFDEVNDGSGAVVYLTPETCGTVIQPRQTTMPTGSTTGSAMQSKPVPIEYYSGGQYLDSEGGGSSTQNGYMLIVRSGLVYTFRLPGDSPVGAARTLEITSIQNGIVTITFGPGDQQAELREGQYLGANIAYDAAVDVEVTVLQINSDGSAIVHVKFPVQSRLAGSINKTESTIVPGIILWCLGSAALYVHAHARYRSRHAKYYDRNWKIEETIK